MSIKTAKQALIEECTTEKKIPSNLKSSVNVFG